MGERVDAARRDDARLAHGAAHLLLAPPGLGDEVARAGQGRADGRAQPLREVDPRRVEGLGERAGGDAARHDGVHEAGAVHVRREAVAPSRFDHALDPLERPDAAAAEIARLLDPEQPAPRGVPAGRTHALVHGRGVELPARAVERAHVDAGQRRRPAGLEMDGMRRPVGQHLVARPAVHAHRDLIAHGARGEKDRRLLAEELRDHLLEVVHRRVLALLLVAHLGVAHEPAHGRRRPGHRVAEEIDIDRR